MIYLHKDEAAKLFIALGNPNAVKICKMLYSYKALESEELFGLIKCNVNEYNEQINNLNELNIIIINKKIEINKDLIDELMSFITTKCKCIK